MQDPFACLVATVTPLLSSPGYCCLDPLYFYCPSATASLQREQAGLREEVSSSVLFSFTIMDCMTLNMDMSRSCGMSNFYSWVVWKHCVEKLSPGHAS